VNIHFLFFESSKENAETLVLLHGLGSSSLDWEYQFQALNQRYQLVVPDIRGHGKSSLEGDFSIELFAKDIEALMSYLHIAHYHIVGLSMGGAIAFQMAINDSPKVTSLIVINSAPGFSKTSPLVWFKIKLRRAVLGLFGLKVVAPKIAAGLFPDGKNQALANKFIERFANNNKTAYLKSMAALLQWDVYPQLDKISCPTLILAAEKDYFSLESKAAYTRQIAKATLQVINNTHHALPVEDPERCNQAILQFLKCHSK